MEQFQRVWNPVNHFPNKAPSTHTEKEAKQGPRTDMEQFFKEYGTNIKSFPNKPQCKYSKGIKEVWNIQNNSKTRNPVQE